MRPGGLHALKSQIFFSRNLNRNSKAWQSDKGRLEESGPGLSTGWRNTTLHLGIPFTFSSVAQSCLTLCDPMDCSMPGLPVHHQLLEFTQTHVHRVGDAIQPSILCHPLFLLLSIFPSIKVFSNESVLRIRWPKYWLKHQLQHEYLQ